ncbi:MAG: efflux RND transporter permease subunit [Rhodospirillales bacterium]
MDLIRAAIARPVAVIAAVIMVVMFGLVALSEIPIQLTPDVRKPIINLRTVWAGAAPAEIEREITNRQEEVLKGLEGLDEISSRSEDGRSSITLEFAVGQNMDKALLLVANRLDRVDGYPDEADEPTIETSGSEDNPIAWIVLRRAEGNTTPIHHFGDFVEDVIKDRLERVPGVSAVNYFGGSEREMEIVVDPEKLARYRLTVGQVVATLRDANASISAGDVDEGKRRYVVRTEGDFDDIGQVRDVVLRSTSDEASGRVARVTVGDIADVDFAYKDPTASIRMLGDPAIAINTVRETGANVIEVMNGIRATIRELNETELPRQGLYLSQVYDETVYIDSSINLVRQNIFLGGSLAAIVLLLFLRSGRATLVVSLAIPVSVVGAFVAMAMLGRSLNVISLAGIAFAVGMVVDAAIVVLENIYRLRERGEPTEQAAYEGARQVWGAILVSALTTVLVFAPILVMDLEVGQLFRDIAVAISVSVLLSLLVAVTVIPALSNWLLRDEGVIYEIERRIGPPLGFIGSGLVGIGRTFVNAVVGVMGKIVANRIASFLLVGIVSTTALAATWAFLPKLDYLPSGNRNLVIGYIVPPPGYNLGTMTDIAGRIESQLTPLWADAENSADAAANGIARFERFFFVATRGNMFLGAAAEDPSRARELIPPMREAAFSEPGTFGLIRQTSLFGRGIGGSRSVDLNVSGPDLEQILGVAQRAAGMLEGVLPRSGGTQMRPLPGLELGSPEVRITPDRIKLADAGVTALELGLTIDSFNDGLRVAEITVDGKRIDLTLKGTVGNVVTTQGIAYLPVVTQSGRILPAGALADVEVTSGPTEIRHLERQRTVTLEISPPDEMPLEQALELIDSQIITPLRDQGLPPGVQLRMSGTADKLTETWNAIVWDLLLAVAIVYLVMAVLFESFLYPLVILFSVPMATAGGVGGLALVNTFAFQPLDMLTLLGFVILIGIVVNNAILLVHQTLYHIRTEKMRISLAIMEATRNRIRPIFMSTATSVFGMLPLVIVPGAGSELYRGLGSVVIGGLSLSAVMTLLIIPPLMSMVAKAAERAHDLKLAAAEGSPAE